MTSEAIDPSSRGHDTGTTIIPITFPSSAPPQEQDAARILDAAISILQRGAEMLKMLSLEAYRAKVPVAFSATIGGHYRHCLDHFTSIVGGLNSGLVNYDARDRDRRIESSIDDARARTQWLVEQISRLSPGLLLVPALVRCEVSYEPGDSPVSTSSLGRELTYAIAHAIHHYALIAVMARLLNVELPDTFGVAPSTVAHNAQQGSSRG